MNKYPSQIVYFEREGRDNLGEVLRVVKKTLRKRTDLRALKLVIFTAEGEGPWMAYNQLDDEFDTKIVAVTFPLDYSAKYKDERIFPRIPDKVKKFFDGVGIMVVSPGPLPFDLIEGLEQHNQQMKIIRDAITIFGGGFTLCIQAVLRACDSGLVMPGEQVIAMGGDCAALITAGMTNKFLTKNGISVDEILCKPRKFNIARADRSKSSGPAQEVVSKQEILPPEQAAKALPKADDEAKT